MRKVRIAIVLIVVSLGVLFITWRHDQATQRAAEIRTDLAERDLRLAMEAVEPALGALGDVGYQYFTPTTAVDRLIPYLNSANMPVGGEMEMQPPGLVVEYVRDRPTGPWQVALVPLEDQNLIRAEAYGTDTTTPLYTTEIRVP